MPDNPHINMPYSQYLAGGIPDITPPEGEMRACAKMCNQCPFSSSSTKGWLGPHTVQQILDGQQFEQPFSCHLHRTDNTTEQDILTGAIPVCRGWLASASKSFKLFGQHTDLGKSLKALQSQVKNEGLEAPDTVLSRQEFREHHILPVIGEEPGQVCNRDGCQGEIEDRDLDGCCTCFQVAPCGHCTAGRYECPECGWHEEDA